MAFTEVLVEDPSPLGLPEVLTVVYRGLKKYQHRGPVVLQLPYPLPQIYLKMILVFVQAPLVAACELQSILSILEPH